jgi:hypothetical protein
MEWPVTTQKLKARDQVTRKFRLSYRNIYKGRNRFMKSTVMESYNNIFPVKQFVNLGIISSQFIQR